MKILLLLLIGCLPLRAMTLEWDMNTEEHLGGYRIYMGEESNNYSALLDVGKVNKYTFESSFKPGKTFFFTVKAYDDKGMEGKESNEVSYTAESIPVEPSPTPALTISDIEGLQDALDAKADTGHVHEIPAGVTQPAR